VQPGPEKYTMGALFETTLNGQFIARRYGLSGVPMGRQSSTPSALEPAGNSRSNTHDCDAWLTTEIVVDMPYVESAGKSWKA
jgi:hypothetical protein